MGHEYGIMGMAGVGFFGMLLIGFLAGWMAERTMNRDHGVLTNILVGIAGSFVGGTAAGLLGFQWYGFLGNLVVATLGAIAILWFFGKREHTGVVRGDTNNRGNRDWRADAPEQGRASDRPEESGSDLPPIYHATSETPSAPPSDKSMPDTQKHRKTMPGSSASKKPTAKRKK